MNQDLNIQNLEDSHKIHLFGDGASSGNPGPGGWGAIIILNSRVIEMGGGERLTTNNRMELTSVIQGLKLIHSLLNKSEKASLIEIYTDSTYVINGSTQWIWGWMKNNWKSSEGKEVANIDLWKELLNWTVALKKIQFTLHWNYVRGHSGVAGNERVDQIAVYYSKGVNPNLYEGPFEQYPISIFPVQTSEKPKQSLQKNQKSSSFISYLSLVNGKPQRHKTWKECEARVKGISGAKFKKTNSSEEERQVLKSWGVNPDQF